MASSKFIADHVRHNSRPFIFAASIPPASCACALASLRVLKKEPWRVQRLKDISNYVQKGLTERAIPHKLTSVPIIPIYTHDPENTLIMAKRAYDGGVYVNPVLPPATPMTECLLRTSYMATHTDSILDEAMDILGNVLEGSK